MTAPINNANFSTHQASPAGSYANDQAGRQAQAGNPAPVAPDAIPADGDRASVSVTAATPAPANAPLQHAAAAREAAAQLRQAIQADPATALLAQQGISGNTAASALARPAA
jgi:hypothetical protein